METVKVDVQKLQILNDRLTQCLEALGQVRLSAHALQPSYGTLGQGGISHSNMPINPGFGGQVPYGTPYTQQSWGGYPQPWGMWNQGTQMGYGQHTGISHTGLPYTPGVTPGIPFGTPFVPQQSAGYGQPWGAWNQTPQFGFGGISHTGLPYTPGMTPGMTPPIPFGTPFVPQQSAGYGQPWGVWNQTPQFGFGGISHSSPWMQHGIPQVGSQVSQMGTTPWFNGNVQPTVPFYGTGISHTSVLNDPFAAARVAHTFPFAFYNTPVW